MVNYYRCAAFLALSVLIAGVVISPVEAQERKRAEDTGYIKARVGFSVYGGDVNLAGESSTAFGAVGGEIGYQFSQVIGLGVGVLRGTYPEAAAPTNAGNSQYHLQLLMNIFPLPYRTLAPYFTVGGQAVTGTPSEETGFGPVGGVGLDLSVSPRFSIFAEAHMNMTFPDEAMDGRDAGDAPYDNGHFLGLGVRATFDRPFVPVDITSFEIPEQLVTGEEGTFSVEVGPRTTEPVEYVWTFGDGTQAEGQTVTHTYEEAGDYEATVTVTNPESQVSRAASVEVIAPPEIVTMTADPSAPETEEQVSFAAQVRGSEPISYSWDVNGQTLSGETPAHTFEEAGNYTVELTAENEAGQDQADITLNVEPAVPPVCEQLMAGEGELNTVHFDFDVAELDAEAEGLLSENVDVLNQCSMIDVLLRGYADHVGSSQYNVRLSQRRAESVEEYYVNEGIDMDRLSTEGMGEAPEPCMKEDPGPGCRSNRRVESVSQGEQ